MQGEGCATDAAKAGEAGLGVAPEGFDAVDMSWSAGEFICAAVGAQMAVTDFDKPVVATPAVGIDEGIERHLAANYSL